MWTPDVYQGAPTPVTAFMSAATKTAAFFAFMRVFLVGFQPLAWDWVPLVEVLAVLSVVLGSIVAIAQRDVKRMLAYSSIAHAGFILMALTNATAVGTRAAMFYLVVYSLMTLGAFGTVLLIAVRGEERTDLAGYRGLAGRSPGLAALMTVFMLSLAGHPADGRVHREGGGLRRRDRRRGDLARDRGRRRERGGGLLLPARDRARCTCSRPRCPTRTHPARSGT